MQIDELLRCRSEHSREWPHGGLYRPRCMKWKGHSGPHVSAWLRPPFDDTATLPEVIELLAATTMVGDYWYG